MKRLLLDSRVALGVIALALTGACADRDSAIGPTSQRVGLATLADPVDIPAREVSLPRAPRPWDTSDSALAAAINRAGGYAVVAFKNPGSRRLLDSRGARGTRAAVSAASVTQGIQFLQRNGIFVEHYNRSIAAALVQMDPALAGQVRSNPLVDWVEPRQVQEGSDPAPGTTSLVRRDHIPRSIAEQQTPWGVEMMRAPTAWQVTAGTGVKLGIIGDPLTLHSDLRPLSCSQFGGPYAADCPWPVNTSLWYWSTFLAGVMYATNNSQGVVGGFRLDPNFGDLHVYVWVACNTSSCDTYQMASGLDAFRWAGVRVALWQGWHGVYDLTVANAVADAIGAGMVVVAPAGSNLENTTTYPAAYDSVIGVSGVKADATFASSSPCGSSSNYNSDVDLSAPFYAVSTPSNSYSGTGEWCGSNIAAAHVAAAAVLVRAWNTFLNPVQVAQRLRDMSRPMTSDGSWTDRFGWGIVDAAAAVGAAPRQPFPPPDTTPPPPGPPLPLSLTGVDVVQPGAMCRYIVSPLEGTAPFTYAWLLDGQTAGDGSEYLWVTNSGSSYEVRVTVVDATGRRGDASMQVTVDPNASTCYDQ